MKTGIIVLGRDSDSEQCVSFTNDCAEYLRYEGRRNVYSAFYHGTPYAGDVMVTMHDQGVDTFVILPLAISEGKHTVWLMPKSVNLPDNFGSWTMIDGKDVATRFATALGSDERMSDALVKREGTPDDETALLLVSRGSPHSSTSKTGEFYADALRSAGWRAEYSSVNYGPEVEKKAKELMDEGYTRIRVIPLFVAFDGRSSESIRSTLDDLLVDVEYSATISDLPVFKEILNSKIPDDW